MTDMHKYDDPELEKQMEEFCDSCYADVRTFISEAIIDDPPGQALAFVALMIWMLRNEVRRVQDSAGSEAANMIARVISREGQKIGLDSLPKQFRTAVDAALDAALEKVKKELTQKRENKSEGTHNEQN